MANRMSPVLGSSPHTRGALVVFSLDSHFGRIIPAYAGSTTTTSSPRTRRGDHPRIRGEHCHTPLKVWIKQGSSPHTRGARSAGISGALDRRIIPAYAGSTEIPFRRQQRRPDHPRIRGEHDDAESGVGHREGSSPHTRGAPFLALPSSLLMRIIPAYAGSTVTPP